jgi:hypothetical protein
MHVYIPVYIPTSSQTLHPLQYFRVIVSEYELDKQDYITYLNCLGLPHHYFNFDSIGTVPTTFSRSLLIPKNVLPVHVEGMEYDFALEAEDVPAYFDFVRTTVALENQRPAFKVRSKAPKTNSIHSLFSLHSIDSIRQTGQEWIGELSEIPVQEEVDPVLVFEYTNRNDSVEYAAKWQILQGYFGSKLRYYVKPADTPRIVWRTSPSLWTVVEPTIPHITSLLRPHCLTLHQLSTGHLIPEKADGSWEMLLGTQVFPQVTIVSTLTLYKTYLIWKKPTQVLETWLYAEECMFLRQLMQSSFSFSLEHAYGLFSSKRHSKLSLTSTPQTIHTIQVQPVDKKESAWETIHPAAQPDQAGVKKELRRLLLEFEDKLGGGEPLPMYLQQYAFLLYLLQQSKDRSRDLEPVIQLFQQTKMDLQGIQIYEIQVQALLSPNTAFLEGELEARIFLELFQFPLEVRLPEQKTKLFQRLVHAFSTQVIQSIEGKRAASSQVWDAFLQFLRRKKLDFVGFFGSQMEFNEVLRELGWEQKRIAQGKVWIGMEIKQ